MSNRDSETANWDAEASGSFRSFMSLVAKFEETSRMGIRFLRGFQQGVEFFRRPPLHKTSEMVGKILETNKTDRVTAYVEAGCQLNESAVQNAERLFSCQLGLQEYIKKVKSLMNELEGASENCISILQKANENSEDLLKLTSADVTLDKLKVPSCEEEGQKGNVSLGEVDVISDPFERIFHLSLMARIIYNMLKLEYAMQEKIASALSLNSSSEELDTYIMLWELQPYVEDHIIQESWALIM